MIESLPVRWGSLLLLLTLVSCVHTGKKAVRERAELGLYFKVKVQKGDKLEFIARNFMIAPAQIRWLNGLRKNRPLQAGTYLIVPVSTHALKSSRIRKTYPLYSAADSDERLQFPPMGRGGILWPAHGVVSWSYGKRGGKPHHGIDIVTAEGSGIQAVQKGKVAFAGWKRGYGWTVIVDHGYFKTLYAHCRELKVKANQHVRQGSLLGLVGRSGNADGAHLHFEYRSTVDAPLDPLPRLAAYDAH